MIQDILPRYQEVANGSKTAFTFPFDALKDEFIEVYLGTTKVTTGWSLSGNTVTFTTAPENGVVVTIYRNIPIEWIETNLGGVGQESIENISTYLVAQIQTIKEGLRRAIQTRITDTDKGEDISDSYIDSLEQATSLYGQCETLLAQVESTGEADLAEMADILAQVSQYGSEVVHIAGAETITGNKRFSGELIKQLNALGYGGVRTQNTVVTKGTAPSSSSGAQYTFQATGGLGIEYRLGAVEFSYDTSGTTAARLEAHKAVAGSSDYAQIAVFYPASGDAYTYAPTPTDTTTTSGTQIATTGWVNSTGNNVVHLTGNETVGGVKTFTSTLTYSGTGGTTLKMTRSDINYSNYVASTKNVYAGFFDATGLFMGGIQSNNTSSGTVMKLMCRKQSDTSTDTSALSYIGVGYGTSGGAYGIAPTPAVSATGTTIATAGYINNKFKKVSTLPASQDADTYYFIPE